MSWPGAYGDRRTREVLRRTAVGSQTVAQMRGTAADATAGGTKAIVTACTEGRRKTAKRWRCSADGRRAGGGAPNDETGCLAKGPVRFRAWVV
jgi:hypothetical protein